MKPLCDKRHGQRRLRNEQAAPSILLYGTRPLEIGPDPRRGALRRDQAASGQHNQSQRRGCAARVPGASVALGG